MGKANKKRSKKADENPTPKVQPVEPAKNIEEDKPFDFGGIPNRDLKKNLGCG